VNFFQMHGIEGMQPMRLNGNISLNSDEVNVKSFKDTFGEMISQINEVTNKPEELTQAAMQGKAEQHALRIHPSSHHLNLNSNVSRKRP
ncbi:MAG: hypothetical protein IKJ37_11685, partial [Kiritimatiellae bacterium]|nr:hypothetical protein [Kiritimatiellia bacterium]